MSGDHLVVYKFDPKIGSCYLFDRQTRELFIIDIACVRSISLDELPRKLRKDAKEDKGYDTDDETRLINNQDFISIRDARTMFDD